MRFGTWLKVLLSVGILAYLAYAVDWSRLVNMIAKVDLALFIVAVVVMGMPILLTSLRWQIILRSQRIVIPIKRVISFDLIALFFNAVLPGSTGGDMVRAICAIRLFPQEKTRIILSLVADRGTGLIVLMSCAGGTLLARPELLARSTLLQSLGHVISWSLFAALTALLVLTVSHKVRAMDFPQRLLLLLKRNVLLAKLLTFLSPFLSRPLLLLSLGGITIASYLCNFLSGYFLAQALHLPLSFAQVVILLAVVYVAISIPISVSGHGVREIVMIGMFAAFAINIPDWQEAAIAYSVLLFGIQLIWSLIGGIYFLGHRSDFSRSTLTTEKDISITV
jgi:uncharacterized protein (TIRG00374 family)